MLSSMNRRQFISSAFSAIMVAQPNNVLAFRRQKEVLAFYYAWYGEKSNNPDWRGVNTVERRIGNSPDYPRTGPYNSSDPSVVRHQLSEMKRAGITGLIFSWWGVNSYEDFRLPMVLHLAGEMSIKVSLYYERCPTADRSPSLDLVLRDFTYLLDRYAENPSWLRVNGQPVFFLYTTAINQLRPDDWRLVMDTIRKRDKRGAFFNAAAVPGYDLNGFDGLHRYALVADVQRRSPDEAAVWARDFYSKFVARQARFQATTLTVYPGYDDTLLNRSKTLRTGRFGGALYEALWKEALGQNPDWILITSWNEWHEGTEIESSDQYDDLYIRMTRRFSDRFFRQ